MCRKIIIGMFLWIVMIYIAGCTRANLYVPSQQDSTKGLKVPKTEDKCVVIIVGHTRNFVSNDWLLIKPTLGGGPLRLIGNLISSHNELTGFEAQIYQTKQNADHFETWQIFSLVVPPGQYSLKLSINVGSDTFLFTKGSSGRFWPIKSSVIEAKSGQVIYLGMLGIDAVGKRGGIGGFLLGSISDIKESWDSSMEHISFVREKIPELHGVDIVHYPLTVEFKN